ncbi:AbfB domain-containing protein [Deinococcus sp. HMF7604]|uniref:AbfB domain-containing protein n=1 Tax=Deinococcus betulae TaxID=2873312 RepID=UPI001CCF32DA|nr:AbfB domain-containing protein [Deinococcus betulae]MBZ9750106.1 AbfB domain-containing protein [Deinococcus betulae]
MHPPDPASTLSRFSRRPWPLALLAAALLSACAGTPQPAATAELPEPPALASATPPTLGALALQPKTPPISTPWTAQVSTTNPLPEYPRPQMTRPDWQSLNGQWQFANASAGQAPPVGQNLAETVLVPFPIESALSGIQRHQDRMWYRRTFTVPSGWNGRRVLLNFGAVDYQAAVYVNGTQVGAHTGGYDAFSFDITGALRAGSNEVIVGVYDPTNAAGQPLGKQVNVPDNGIFYTAASGIWQTVWLEPVAAPHITRLDLTPDVPGGALKVTVRGEGLSGQTVQVTGLNGTTVVGTVNGNVDTELRLPVPNARLWNPDDPFLYNLTVKLVSGSATVDTVQSYFGMRSIGTKVINGFLRPVLNGKFVFQLGTLDQGYWPDGIYTAPTDDALKSDLQKHKDLGFNMVRKHIKVEPQRWYYWADRLGLLVWQDMPSMRIGVNPSSSDRAEFERELRIMVDQHRSSPSIVTWVAQNEGWGEYDPARIADAVKAWDPSRLVDNMSGWNCCGYDGGNGDLADWHVYVGPGTPNPSLSRVSVLGEFGGLGLRTPGHEWNPNTSFSYEMQPSVAAFNDRYLGLVQATRALMINKGLSASIYTELTDVESEVNGLYTYDRQIAKIDVARARTAHLGLIAASNDLPVKVTLPLYTYKSFQVTTPGFTNRFIRHLDGLGATEVVTGSSAELLKKDATWRIVPGLADANCYSLESLNYPGEYLRHRESRVRRDRPDGSSAFNGDATWCARSALSGVGISLESYNFPGRYLRHYDSALWLAQNGGPLPSDSTGNLVQDSSWNVVTPWARSGVTLANAYQSLQVTTAGFTDRFARHQNGLGFTEVVTGGSPALLKQDATFRLAPGLADSRCTSFEARNLPGQYLRHRDFRIGLAANDNTDLFRQDATFCAQPGLGGGGVSFEAFNSPGFFLRHFDSGLWIASGGGARPSDSAGGFKPDSTWTIAAPWAP